MRMKPGNPGHGGKVRQGWKGVSYCSGHLALHLAGDFGRQSRTHSSELSPPEVRGWAVPTPVSTRCRLRAALWGPSVLWRSGLVTLWPRWT